ncbi:hypothetical protein PVAP13_6KG028035 [Panicum virgatum]|uniref:Uncharacterized protein n=1 Tax=Panicum virgatum TaxID=38727 RepID=A0A8T0R938_PANVG|nr:hypothetical protein PVAP13_6KG028035 [Panicum virgatum]
MSTELGVFLGNEATARESSPAFPARIPARRRQRDQKTTRQERKSKKASRSLGMDSTELQFFALGDGFLVFPLVACNGRRHCGRRGGRFRGGCGRRFSNGHPRHRSPGRRPAPMAPPPGHQPGPSTTAAAASSSTSDSSERTGTAPPPYMTGIVDERNVVAPTPPTSGNAGLGLQAGPSTNIGGTTMALHSSFIVGTRAARRGAPPFYKAGNPSTAASATSTPPASPATPIDASASTAPSLARLLGHMAATDRRSGIRRGTWSPAMLGLSSGH